VRRRGGEERGGLCWENEERKEETIGRGRRKEKGKRSAGNETGALFAFLHRGSTVRNKRKTCRQTKREEVLRRSMI
jgi:hypothetical protein